MMSTGSGYERGEYEKSLLTLHAKWQAVSGSVRINEVGASLVKVETSS
jgi:hypothetical protein